MPQTPYTYFCNWTTLMHRALTRTFISIYAKWFKYIGWHSILVYCWLKNRCIDDVVRAGGQVLRVLWLLTCYRRFCQHIRYCFFRRVLPQQAVSRQIVLLPTIRRLMMAHATHWFIFSFYFWQHIIRNFTRTPSVFHSYNSMGKAFYSTSILSIPIDWNIYTQKPIRIVFFLVIVHSSAAS